MDSETGVSCMDPQILESNALFTNELYQILSRKNGNVFFSPFSIHAVLSMAHQGARGDSAEAFAKILHNSDIQATASGYRSVMDYLNSLKQVALLVANKIYAHQTSIQLKKDFEVGVKENFHSEIELVNFDNSETIAKINDWVAQKTNNKIRKILENEALKGQSGLVLINTICFKGEWFWKFKEEATINDKFYLEGGDAVDVRMMCNPEKSIDYTRNEEIGVDVVGINFVGRSAQMIIILPFETSNIKQIEAKLTTKSLAGLIDDLDRHQVILQLPKFKIEETIELNEVLKEMGLGVVFDQAKADFSGIVEEASSTDNLYVASVIQKAYIDVNEYGCEATAASSVKMPKGSGLRRQEPVVFKVNRPCIFMIIASDEEEGKNIFFYGRLSHPKY